MKNKLTIFLFFCSITLVGQTRIGSIDLALKKSSYHHQIHSAVDNSTGEFFVMASDKDVVTVAKYNKALFYSKSLKTTTDKNYPLVAGNSFNHENNLVFHWTSKDFRKFMSQTYDFNTLKTDTVQFEIPFKDELLLTSFQQNNRLYFLSYQKKEEQLKLYTLRGNSYDEKTIDFRSFMLRLNQSKSMPAAKYVASNPIEVIDNQQFNPLFSVANKTKIYALKDKLLITLDYDTTHTHAFEIDWNTNEVKEKFFLQPTLSSEEFNSNSFYYNENLYQLKANKSQLTISKHDYTEKENVKEYNVLAKEKITFANSPLYIQNGTYQPREIKTTEKFLKRLKNKPLGISVYQTEGDLLITLGGTTKTLTSDGIVLGSLLTISGIILGDYGTFPDMTSNEIMQNVYFECRFDNDFKPKSIPFGPLAVDYISDFFDNNNAINLHTTTRYKDYFILSYYDEDAQQIILRKFEDGYLLISDY